MAVQSFELLSMDFDEGPDRALTYKDSYIVITDVGDGQGVAMSALGFSIKDQYGGDSECHLHARSCSLRERGASSFVWDVEYTWSTGIDQMMLAPWERDSVTTWTTTVYQKEIWEDVNGNPIVSTNSLPWQNQTMCDDSRIEITITNWLQDFNGEEFFELRDCLNEDEFLGGAPKTVKFANLQSTEIHDTIWGTYWEKNVTFQYDPLGWTLKRLATGMKAIDDNGNLSWVFVNGQPTNEPVCLDNNGKVLPIGLPPIELEFEIYNATDLSVLL